MDTALQLKQRLRTETLSDTTIQRLLLSSELVSKLLHQQVRTDTFTGLRKLEFRLLELSEIPFALELPAAKELLQMLGEATFVSEGFSLTGQRDGVLACHQGIMTLIFSRAKNQHMADHGVAWILRYQITERHAKCLWTGRDLYERFGACVGQTPCYDGLIKNMVALSDYQQVFGRRPEIQDKLEAGLAYILAHGGIYHIDGKTLLSDDIGKFFYPYPYRTNVLEVLSLMKNEGLFHHETLKAAREHVINRPLKVEKIFMPSSWTTFDSLHQDGLWLADVVKTLFEGFDVDLS